jgi:hypothetical protein
MTKTLTPEAVTIQKANRSQFMFFSGGAYCPMTIHTTRFDYTDAKGVKKFFFVDGENVLDMNDTSILTQEYAGDDQFGDPTYDIKRFRFDRMANLVVVK